jgi:hypothetical protein
LDQRERDAKCVNERDFGNTGHRMPNRTRTPDSEYCSERTGGD